MSLLEVRRLSKHFGGLQALSDVDFEIAPGEIVGLIGPNGAGKSTLINAITGVHPPDAGTIRFDGRDLAGLPPDRITRLGIGRTFQIPQPLGSLSCLDNVAIAALFGRRVAGVEAAADEARATLDVVGLAVCDRIVVLDFGRKIAEGAPAEIGRNPEVIRAYLGRQRGGSDAHG